MQQIELLEPLVNPGTVRGTRFVVREDRFQPGGPNAAIFLNAGCHHFQDVELVTDALRPRLEWDQTKPEVGFNWTTAGLRFQGSDSLSLQNVFIRGFPGKGIAGGMGELVAQDVAITDCNMGINVEAGPTFVHLSRVSTWDMWGLPTEKNPEYAERPSLKYPERCIGGDGIALNSCSGYVVDCRTTEEHFGGFKAVSSRWLEVERLVTESAMVQGLSAEDPAFATVFRDCHFRKNAKRWNDGKNQVQLSIYAKVELRGCLIDGSPDYDGHGIQLADHSHAQIYGCTIVGHNGERGGRPAKAIHISDDTCSVNANVEAVNDIQGEVG